MKNNILFFLFILIFDCLIIINANSNEPFKFNVTEIEIIDNGNTIKGIKGGVVTTDSGLKIEANTFVYDKILNILNAHGSVKITDVVNDYQIFSEKITYIKKQEKIFTNGKTKVILESQYTFTSKNVLFLKNEMILSSSEKSSLDDGELNLYKFDEFEYSINEEIL